MADPDTATTDLADVAAADLPVFTSLVESFADTSGHDPPWLDAAALTVSTDELGWIERAAPLLGQTPRAVKLFANVYLLLRSVGRGWTLPPSGQVVVLLALATGLPRLAGTMLTTIEEATASPFTLASAVPDTEDPDLSPDRTVAAERRQLLHWLDDDQAAKALDVGGLTDWIDLIRRFRFVR